MTGRLTALAVAGILFASAAGAQAPASPGPAAQTRWINDHGSELFIESVGPDGRLAGTYLSGAPGFQCRNIAFPLTGWVDGARLAYAVQWKNTDVNCSQITSWTGFVHGGRIFVEWVLVYFDASQGRQSVSRGFDQYRPK